jgi:hypothetical protein
MYATISRYFKGATCALVKETKVESHRVSLFDLRFSVEGKNR